MHNYVNGYWVDLNEPHNHIRLFYQPEIVMPPDLPTIIAIEMISKFLYITLL